MRRHTLFALLAAVSCSSGSGDDTKTQGGDLQAEFDAFVAQHNSCTSDADCTLVDPGCPLGCYAAVNLESVGATEAKAQELVDEYQSSGQACNYDCIAPAPIRCEAQHCTVEPETSNGGCTLIGCGSAFQVTFQKTSAWAAGDYRVVVGMDGTNVECTATLPLTCDAPFPCSDPNVLLILSGCALPPSEHSLGGVDIVLGTPATVSIEVFYQGQSVATDQWTPAYITSRPNGAACDPECTTAPGETMTIP